MNRRGFVKASLGAAAAMGAGDIAASEAAASALAEGGKDVAEVKGETSDWTLRYNRPAREWLEALPVGNGWLAAMIYGGVERDTLQLNEGTVWAGGPHDYNNLEALAALPEIRRRVFAGEWKAAQDLVNAHFMSRPLRQAPYQTVGSLEIDFGTAEGFTDYRRELDLDRAVVTTSYRLGGVQYTREIFASVPDKVIVVRLAADKPGCLTFTTRLRSPQKSATRAAGSDGLALDGVSGDADGVPGGVKFCALVRARNEGGKVTASSNALTVTGADAVTLLITVGTSHRSYKDVDGDAIAEAQKRLVPASRKGYSALQKAHLADYQPRFRRLSLDLGHASDAALALRPTNERIRTFATDNDPSLPALYVQYGRYLLLSCSRPGGPPATLQGLWNESMDPPWGSKYTININTEMNYWLAGPGNILECYAPLFDLLMELAESGAKTAKTHYGVGGWMCHHNTNGWRGSAPVDGAFWGMWPTGGAWLCKSIWDYYEYTGDRVALARHYPLLKGATQFFLEALVEDPKHGVLVTCPSNSPENAHHRDASICAGPTMDNQILRDLFDACARASEVLKRDGEFRAKVTAARARLAPNKIGAQGQLQEWLEDWDASAPEQKHRHVSHLYGLYPSEQITKRGTPELFAAARKSLETRGDESTGWAMAWRINLWARLEDGPHAYKLLAGLLTPARTAPNLFDLHPPFQIDGNFGGATGVLEMLLQSYDGALHLLPALPPQWPNGSVRGMRARGGFEVGLNWAGGKLTRATILSHIGGPCTLRLDEKSHTFDTQSGRTYTVNGLLADSLRST